MYLNIVSFCKTNSQGEMYNLLPRQHCICCLGDPVIHISVRLVGEGEGGGGSLLVYQPIVCVSPSSWANNACFVWYYDCLV